MEPLDLPASCRDGSVADAVVGLSDLELGTLIAAAQGEMRRRAVESGDLDAIVREGFEVGFEPSGAARDPWVRGQVIVCPGAKVASSAMAHRCRFVALDDGWVWESVDLLADEVRPQGRHSTASVSLVVAREGLELEVVSSRARNGSHERTGVRRFVVRGGELVEGGTGVSRARDHR